LYLVEYSVRPNKRRESYKHTGRKTPSPKFVIKKFKFGKISLKAVSIICL